MTAVFPPDAPSEGAPAFTTRYHRFRTEPAPWSEEEGWKGRAPHKAAGDSTLDGNEHVSPGGAKFEQEKDTCPIPAELDVWVDCTGIEDFDPQCVVGMGIRARWAQIGTEDKKWWIFKLKDCEYNTSVLAARRPGAGVIAARDKKRRTTSAMRRVRSGE